MLGWFSQFREKISEAKIQKFRNFIQTTCIPRFFTPIGFCRGLFSIYWCWIVVRRHPDGGRRGRRDLADFDSCHLFLQFWMLNFWLFWMLLTATYMPIKAFQIIFLSFSDLTCSREIRDRNSLFRYFFPFLKITNLRSQWNYYESE